MSLLADRRNAADAIENARKEVALAQCRLMDAQRQQRGTYSLDDLNMGSNAVLLPTADLRLSSKGNLYVHPKSASSSNGSAPFLMEVRRVNPSGDVFGPPPVGLEVILPRDINFLSFAPGTNSMRNGFDGIDQGWNRVVSMRFEEA